MNSSKVLFFTLMAVLLAAGHAQATITVINYWHLGEGDAGAVPGAPGVTTVDAVAGHILTNTTVGGFYPSYTSAVAVAAAAETASTLALSYTNGQYGTGLVATNLTDNFGMECWVKPGDATGNQVLANNGLRANGWGLYQAGNQFEVLFGGKAFFGSGSAPAMVGTWEHLALVRSGGVATLYTNGVPASTSALAPLAPAGAFTIGGDASFPEYFTGSIDEVRVFTFAAGAFSTNDLLLNSTNVSVLNTADSGPGSLRGAVASGPKGSHITFASGLSGQTITLTNGQIELSNNVTIDGSALPGGVQINGNAGSRIFQVDATATAGLISLTLTNGQVQGAQGGAFQNGGSASGGGIYNSGALTLKNSTLANNECSGGSAGIDAGGGDSFGGGVYNNGTLILNGSLLANNNSSGGGGSFQTGGAGNGGGIYNAGMLLVSNSTLANNTASGAGAQDGPGGGSSAGGIYNASVFILVNSTLVNNISQGAGGDAFENGGDANGGGIYNSGTLRANNDTIVDNSGIAGAGGEFAANGNCSGGGILSTVTLQITNSIICSNTANSGLNISGSFPNANNLVDVDALVAPLANYGGPTPTMPPVPGSPAINGGRTTTLSTDQRGLPRAVGVPDIGAVEIQTGEAYPIVLNTSDANPGSLRQTIISSPANPTITFSPAISGQVIKLTSGQIALNKNLAIDGSALASLIRIDGNHAARIFRVDSGATVTLNSLVMSNGFASGSYGGAVSNSSSSIVSVQNCLVISNSADIYGGGLINNGIMVVSNSTVANNHAGNFGGGINNDGTLSVKQSTLAGNSAGSGGGGISSGGLSTIVQSTIAANSASSSGGGIHNGGSLLISNTIVSANSASTSPDIDGSVFSSVSSQLAGNALLAGLGYYGGKTPTMPPLPGSPVIDAGSDSIGSVFSTDQRGLPRSAGAHVDIGAVEAGDAIPGINYGIVSTTNDFLNGLTNSGVSLRSAVAFVPVESFIRFAPALAGQTITLSNGEIAVNNNPVIDGGGLASGIQISGNHNSRIFNINANGVTLIDLTVINGNGGGADGGAILNAGNCVFNECTFMNNSTGTGGAIKNTGNSLALDECTFTANTATSGGGGAIANYGGLFLNSCTLAGNAGGGMGGALYNDTSGHATLGNTIASANTVVDIFNSGTVTLSPPNILQSTGGFGAFIGPGATNGNPQLAAIGNYGGLTPTMPPLPGSPAIDIGDDTQVIFFATDQRGYPRRVGAHVDVGAVEGVFNAAGSGPIKNIASPVTGTVQLSFTNITDAVFPVMSTTDLSLPISSWTRAGFATESPVGSGQFLFIDMTTTNYPQRFYRVRSP